uniref:Uncharacterized protein n=1 Tax=Rhizophora mucronata TaxID=61149 RepID=A0A2P2Q0A8_RHIMU
MLKFLSLFLLFVVVSHKSPCVSYASYWFQNFFQFDKIQTTLNFDS